MYCIFDIRKAVFYNNLDLQNKLEITWRNKLQAIKRNWADLERKKREFFKDKISSSKNPKEFWSLMEQSTIICHNDPKSNLAPNFQADEIN